MLPSRFGCCSVRPRPQSQLRPLNAKGKRPLTLCRPPVRAAGTAVKDEAFNPLGLTFHDVLKRDERVLGLPPPPQKSNFTFVIPYLIRLAVEERALLWRVGLAFMCLLLSKSAGLMGPLMIRDAVNSFSSSAPNAVAAATKALLLYGACDIMKHCSKEMQGPLFTPVSQAASRRVAYHTFSHIMGLDVQYHLERRTGRVARILERGTRSIQMLYRAVIFTFIPTAIELMVVCTVLARQFSPAVGALVVATFACYVMWSITMTRIAADARKEVNVLDNATGAKCVDALLNFETVALFGNQKLETLQYNEYLKAYRAASVKTERLACMLNAGQALILSCGLTSILVTAVNSSVGGAITAGDLMMIQGLLLQLWAPLQFLGWFYRELRSALVDMEEFFAILRTQPNIKDGQQDIPDRPPSSAASPATVAQQPSTKPSPPASSPSSSSADFATAAGTAISATNGRGGTITSPSSSSSSSSSNSSSNGSSSGEHYSARNGTDSSESDSASLSMSSMNGRGGEQEASSSAFSSTTNGSVTSRSSSSEEESTERYGGGYERVHSGREASGSQRGLRVDLKDVNFGYAGSRQVLRGISVTMEPGTSTAFVGSSGSGKSTILKLLTRLYDVNAGAVELNGVDIRDLKLEAVRKAVAVVPQETILLNDTIMSNIRYGWPTASDEEVIEAAKMASLHEAVMAMPGQYHSVVGERGLKLSGGEKQRVAIARAFLREPRLLICDEATSSLDSATEAQIIGSLSQLAQGRTSIFVAHRLSTVRQCDQIVVLKGGVVVERGSHDDLMAIGPGGVYYNAWQLQAREDVSGDKGSTSSSGLSSDSDDEGLASWLPQAATASQSMDSSLSAIGAGARAG